MSLDNTDHTENATAEEVFADLEQQLKRLNSAVSHLSLSEQAATQAIAAAEQVVQQQHTLSQQLKDYVEQLPRPAQGEDSLRQLESLTEAIERQSRQLQEVQQLLQAEAAIPQPSESADYEQLQALTTAVEEGQERTVKAVEMVGQLVQKGVTHYPSQQLADFLRNAMEPIVPVAEMQPTLIRNQQVLQDIQLLLKGLSASSAPESQAITKSIQGLTGTLKPEFGHLAKQASEVQKMLEEIKSQLSKSSLTEQKVESLEQMVRALTRSAVTQQEGQKRQNTLTLLTLLIALSTLAGLAVHFLRG